MLDPASSTHGQNEIENDSYDDRPRNDWSRDDRPREDWSRDDRPRYPGGYRRSRDRDREPPPPKKQPLSEPNNTVIAKNLTFGVEESVVRHIQ